MVAVRASLRNEPLQSSKRSTVRRKLRLDAPDLIAGDSDVLIMDISTTGLLIKSTTGDLRVGEIMALNLLDAPGVRAVVKWSSGQFFGCQFTEPVPVATVSAALLRAPPKMPHLQGLLDSRGVVIASEVPGTDLEPKLSLSIRLRWILALTIASWGLLAALLALVVSAAF